MTPMRFDAAGLSETRVRERYLYDNSRAAQSLRTV